MCTDCDKSSTGETIAVVSHSFLLISLLKILTCSPNVYNVEGWTQSTAFKLIRNASFISLDIERRNSDCKNSKKRTITFSFMHHTSHLDSLEAHRKDTLRHLTEANELSRPYSDCIHV